MPPTRQDFKRTLRSILYDARDIPGIRELTLNAGGIHRAVGGYPRIDHRMPMCCDVMKEEIHTEYGDEVLPDGPQSGQGASFTVRYCFPRPHIVAWVTNELDQ